MADARNTARELPDEPGCWQKKAAYELCFDNWYKDVFLQNKANGEAGCRDEYKAYWNCYMKELRKDPVLVESIRSVMPKDTKERWSANMDAHAKAERNSSK